MRLGRGRDRGFRGSLDALDVASGASLRALLDGVLGVPCGGLCRRQRCAPVAAVGFGLRRARARCYAVRKNRTRG